MHHIGANKQYLFITTVPEIVNAAMLKKTSDDASDLNGLTHAGQAWTQATHAAYDQIEAYTSLRSAIERVNYFRVNQCIHLKDQVTIAIFTMQRNFAINALQHALP